MMLIIMILSYIFCISINPNHCDPLKNNARAIFKFICYENSDPVTVCKSDKGYKKCNITLSLCIQSTKHKLDDTKPLKCDVTNKSYDIPNNRLMCIKGRYDTRGKLKESVMFDANWDNIHMYLKISIKPFIENKSFEYDRLYHKVQFYNNTIKKSTFDLSGIGNNVRPYIRVKVQVKLQCLPNFSGAHCEEFCFTNSCKKRERDICTTNWTSIGCPNINVMANIDQCNKKFINDTCSDQYISCINKLSECPKEVLTTTVTNPKVVQNAWTKKVIKTFSSILIVGLLVVILLMMMVILIWKFKVKGSLEEKVYNNSSSYSFFTRYIGFARPPVKPQSLNDKDKDTDSNYSEVKSLRSSLDSNKKKLEFGEYMENRPGTEKHSSVISDRKSNGAAYAEMNSLLNNSSDSISLPIAN